jgi:hypothetical protein
MECGKPVDGEREWASDTDSPFIPNKYPQHLLDILSQRHADLQSCGYSDVVSESSFLTIPLREPPGFEKASSKVSRISLLLSIASTPLATSMYDKERASEVSVHGEHEK